MYTSLNSSHTDSNSARNAVASAGDNRIKDEELSSLEVEGLLSEEVASLLVFISISTPSLCNADLEAKWITSLIGKLSFLII